MLGPGESEANWELTACLCLSLPICAVVLKAAGGLSWPWHPTARRPGHLSRSGRSVCPLPAKEHSSAIRESIFQSQKSTLHSPQSLQEATWERRGVLESHMLPGKEEEVPGRQSLQGGLGGAGLSLPRKEERRSPN